MVRKLWEKPQSNLKFGLCTVQFACLGKMRGIEKALLEIKTGSGEAGYNPDAYVSVTFPLGNCSYLYIENCQAAVFSFLSNPSKARGFCFVLNAAETLFPWPQIICAESQVSS